MSKKLYRYELYCDNEYQGIGIFQGLIELDLREDIVDEMITPFDSKLRIPDIDKRCEFLFTDKGHTEFHEGICCIAHSYNESLFSVRLLEVDEDKINPKDVIYRDMWQIAVVEGTLDKFRKIQ